jgi:signal transduction histidine kinase
VVGDEEEVRVRVRNSGPRLDHLENLFEPLVRGSADPHATDSSLGLGLYIAREIARRHGGDIEGASDGAGTVFSVRLPREPRGLAEHAGEEVPQPLERKPAAVEEDQPLPS